MKFFFHLSIFILLGLILIFVAFPIPEQVLHPESKSPTQILDRNGKLLYEVRQPDYGSQDFLPLKDIPPRIIDALLATEDRSFYSHWGISIRSIMRALWQNYEAGKVVSGGSTITQQLVRNRLQPERRGYAYKLYEMFLALKLETKLSKEEILEAYLNTAYFGEQTYGIKAASKTYFDKSPRELSLAEVAFLIGLLQSPSGFNPYQNFESAKNRQLIVLKSMKNVGVISTQQFEESEGEKIRLAKPVIDIKAPHFVFWLLQKYSSQLQTTNYKLPTTLDLDLQTEIEQIITNELKKLEKKHVTSAAVIVLDAETGEILTMVGSADYFDMDHDGQVNVAISNRQPGSTLKPFTYALAFSQGATAASTVSDIEAQFFTEEGNPYTPRNYDYQYHGLVRYREALANSYNIPAVKVLERVGVEKLLNFLRTARISTLIKNPEFYGLALTLGDGEVKLLELAKAYAIFPRGGKTLPIKALLDEIPTQPEQILDERLAWLISDILSDQNARLPEFGEDGPLDFDRPVAAKTGTTRNSRDNWTIGFTPDRIVGVWVGNADNSPMIETSGITGAGPIFHEVMIAATRNLPPKPFQRPLGFTRSKICKLSGKRPTGHCPHAIEEWFIAGTEPKEPDDLYRPVLIDLRNNLLASENCNSPFVQEKVFAFFPPELQKWSRENGWEKPPTGISPFCRLQTIDHRPSTLNLQPSTLNPELLTITSPSPGDTFKLDPLIPDEDEKIIFEAQADTEITTLDWYANGEFLGSGSRPDFRFEWHPNQGSYEITARVKDLSHSIHVNVIE